jgi:hypothetical protein
MANVAELSIIPPGLLRRIIMLILIILGILFL